MIAFVGTTQLPPVVTVAAAVIEVAVVESVLLAAFVNVVEVPVMFQPAPLPLRSLGVRESVVETVWFVPFTVTPGNETLAGAPSVSEPPRAGRRLERRDVAEPLRRPARGGLGLGRLRAAREADVVVADVAVGRRVAEQMRPAGAGREAREPGSGRC